MTEIRLEKSLPSEQERVGQPSVPAEGLERYFAREGVDPLPYAFEGKSLCWRSRGRERPWRTSMCRFVRRTACTAVSTTRHTAKTKAGSTPTRSFRSCACGGAAPDRMPGRYMPCTWAEARPRRCRRTISGAAARQRLRDHGGRASVEFRPGQDGSVLRGRGKPFFTRGAEL